MASDETALIEAARRGDAEAFGVLVERYMPRALAFARQMTGDPAEAEDLVQDAFVKAYRKIGDFKGESGFYTWFYRLMTNRCLDHLRRRGLVRRLFVFRKDDQDGEPALDPLDTASDQSPGSSPERGYEQKETRDAISRALSKLSGRQRAVFLLRHNEGMATADVAAVLGISEGAVKSHLARAVAGLKESLKGFR